LAYENAEFGAYLRHYREERGLHLREVARKAAMSHAYLSQVERGEPRNLSDEKLLALGTALGHESIPELFGRAGRVSPQESATIRQNPTSWSKFILRFMGKDKEIVNAFLEKTGKEADRILVMTKTYKVPRQPGAGAGKQHQGKAQRGLTSGSKNRRTPASN
jgi:transcriptional regulator with XRE-family HTH domain